MPKVLIIIAHKIIVRVGTFLKNALYSSEPIMLQMFPRSTSIENINLDTPITFIRKKYENSSKEGLSTALIAKKMTRK